jgi:hypothetical protein
VKSVRRKASSFVQPYKELKRHLIDDEDWYTTFAMSQLRDNLSCHAATGMTPYRAIFGSNAFDFECFILARSWTDDDHDDLAARLKEVHARLLERGVKVGTGRRGRTTGRWTRSSLQ